MLELIFENHLLVTSNQINTPLNAESLNDSSSFTKDSKNIIIDKIKSTLKIVSGIKQFFF